MKFWPRNGRKQRDWVLGGTPTVMNDIKDALWHRINESMQQIFWDGSPGLKDSIMKSINALELAPSRVDTPGKPPLDIFHGIEIGTTRWPTKNVNIVPGKPHHIACQAGESLHWARKAKEWVRFFEAKQNYECLKSRQSPRQYSGIVVQSTATETMLLQHG